MAQVRTVTSFWFCSLHHARSVRDDDDRARRVASVLNVPAMRSFRRVAVTVKARETEHRPNSPEQLRKHLQHPVARGVVLDSGRSGEPIADGTIQTALDYKPDADIVAPMTAHLVLPYVADDREAVLDVFCSLAEILESAWGATSVEPSFQTASNATGAAGPSSADAPTYTVMTPDRIRYRRTPGFCVSEIAHGIGGPEWGTFLGPAHLARLPPATLTSDAFHHVRPLAHGGAFIRLSTDPMDAQSESILALVANARAALEPILLDISSVRL